MCIGLFLLYPCHTKLKMTDQKEMGKQMIVSQRAQRRGSNKLQTPKLKPD